MLYRLAWIVLSLTVVTALSGCLVDKKKPSQVTKILRTTNNLHIYKNGESIDYNVRAVNASDGTVSYGQLHIQWASHANLTDPIDGVTPYPVLKETATLDYDDTSSEPDITVVRYISQDGAGNITLHAIEDSIGDLYWPTEAGNTDLNANVANPTMLGSPLSVGMSTTPVAFYAMAGCGDPLPPSPCTEALYRFTNDYAVAGDTTEITTNLGTFTNPLELNFSGTISPQSSSAISVFGDILDACGTSEDNINHSGTLFIMPEVGVIKMDNTCQNYSGTGKTLHYTVTINDTNITRPW